MFIRVVRHTPDLERIKSLPRRTLTLARAEVAAARYTSALAVKAGVELRPWQGASLAEVEKNQGGFLWLPVGQGKTLLAETIPVVLKSKRAALILPASLREKTFSDRATFRGVWRTGAPPPRLISKEELALEANAYLLDQLKLDLVIIDEADELANWNSAATRRLWRYKRENPHVRFVCMSGTFTRRSILAYWHLLILCLGELAPVPLSRADAELWAAALDDAAPRDGFRPNPGALGATLEQARAWYLDRLSSTPGVVIVDEDSAADVPFSVRVELTPDCPILDDAFEVLREKWQSPSGELISDTLSLLRIEGQLGCGLYSYWHPKPPQDWLRGRQGIAKFIRGRIAATSHAQRPLDTDAQVMRAHPDAPQVREWLRVRGKFDPLKNSRTEWISEATLFHAAEWLRRKPGPSVMWCGGVEFADRLSKLTKLPYYGPKGKEVRTGRELHSADPKKSMICSWHANRRGFNLQAWRRHAIIQPPQSAKALEQLFGRAHRNGQTEPVDFTILATSGGTLDSFTAAYAEALFAKESTGTTQKLLRAELEPLPDPPATLRWATR